jgi:Glycoside Hydrolase Family 113
VAERGLASALGLSMVLFAVPALAAPRPVPTPRRLPPGQRGWLESGLTTIRGVTVGPIESSLHLHKGYGSQACAHTMRDVRRLGGNWVSITPFGRVWDLAPSGVSMTFEAPYEKNRVAVMKAVEQAHAEGLRVLLVPHLWVESGGWRALIDPGDDAAWARWAKSYRTFLLNWAQVAREAHVDMFSVGVELRSWVTTRHAPSFVDIIHDVRQVYPGLLTYAANWDDVDRTVVLGELDVIGINAFYPLADHEGASFDELLEGGRKVASNVARLSNEWDKPVLFTEFGYTTRTDPAVKPWEWPEQLKHVTVDQVAQARAYEALLAPLTNATWFAGFFVWRVYADPFDVSQEPAWGFSPRGKLAELVLEDAFRAHWADDGPRRIGSSLFRFTAWGSAPF